MGLIKLIDNKLFLIFFFEYYDVKLQFYYFKQNFKCQKYDYNKLKMDYKIYKALIHTSKI